MLFLALLAFAEDCPPGTARTLAGTCEAIPVFLEDGGCRADPKADQPGCAPRPSEAVVMGGLSKDQVDATIRGVLPQARACRADPAVRGRVTVRFSIGADGRVATSEVESSSHPDPTVGTCLAAEVGKLVFPKASGTALVTYPFDFE